MTCAKQIWTLLWTRALSKLFLLMLPGYRVPMTEGAKVSGNLKSTMKERYSPTFQRNEWRFCIIQRFIFLVKWITTKVKTIVYVTVSLHLRKCNRIIKKNRALYIKFFNNTFVIKVARQLFGKKWLLREFGFVFRLFNQTPGNLKYSTH